MKLYKCDNAGFEDVLAEKGQILIRFCPCSTPFVQYCDLRLAKEGDNMSKKGRGALKQLYNIARSITGIGEVLPPKGQIQSDRLTEVFNKSMYAPEVLATSKGFALGGGMGGMSKRSLGKIQTKDVELDDGTIIGQTLVTFNDRG